MKKLIPTLTLAALSLFAKPNFGSVSGIKDNVDKNLMENFQASPTVEQKPEVSYTSAEEKLHEKIIHMSFDEIVKTYKEKAEQIIKKHLWIEINKARKTPLADNPVLQELAQEHADDMQKNTYYSHKDRS